MKKIFFYLVVFVLFLIPVLALFHPGLPKTHDGQDHVARIANFYLNLSQGNLIPRWAPNLNWGYGHPILEFLYPLPSYVASFFHFVGFSLVDSTKIVFGLGMVLSFIFMFLWLRLFLPKAPSLFGAFLYTYAPYRFVELYVRGDVGENFAFAFVPLTLFFIYRYYKNKKLNDVLWGSISLCLLILAHNAISLMFVPLIFLYCIYLAFLSQDKKIFYNYIVLIILGFGFSAFFWIPAFFEGKYTLRNIVTKGGYVLNFVNFKNLFYGPWSYGISGQFTVQLGIVQWLSLLASPFLVFKYFKTKDKTFWLVLGLILGTVGAVFLMLPVSNFLWQKIMLLQNFQFPWRFLAITVFTTSVLGAFLIHETPKRLQVLLITAFILFVFFVSRDYMKPQIYLSNPDSVYSGIYNSTTDTGESAPIWSVRFMEHRPLAPAQIIEQTGSIKETIHRATYRQYLFNAKNKARVLVNILYFPKWTIYIDGKEMQIQFQDQRYRGLITFYVPSGRHTIEAVFRDTNLRIFSELISAISILTVLLFYGFKFVKKRIY